MVKITDRESAEAWLKTQPREVQVAFAARCAMRVLPTLGNAGLETFGRVVLPSCRAILTAGVTALVSTPAVRNAAAAAAAAIRADSSRAAAADAAYAAARAAFDSTRATFDSSRATFDSSRFTFDSTRANTADAAASDDVSRVEDGATVQDLFAAPLWPDGMPEGLRHTHDSLTALWDAAPATWCFWQEWYEGMLAGRPMDWTLQEAVALIPDEVWEAGPEAVAAEIALIRRDMAKSPLPRDVVERQVVELIAHADLAQCGAEGLARQIEEAISLFMHEAQVNALPQGFAVLENLPSLLRRLGRAVEAAQSDADAVADLEAQIQEMAAEIQRLKSDLAAATAVSGRTVFSKAFCEQAGKSLGDWKLWGALTTGAWVFLGAPTAAEPMAAINAMVRDFFGSVATPPP